MASGTIALSRNSTGVYLIGQIVWSSVSNGTAANTSTVTATLQLQRDAANTTTGTFKGTFTVGGTSETISWYGSLPSRTWVTVKTVTATVSHNANGSGSCYLYATVNGPTGTTMEGTYVSGSATVALDKIPRHASLISVTDFTDEGNPIITYSNPAGTAVDSLQACISLTHAQADVPYKDMPKTGTGYSMPLTLTERNTLRAATPNSNALTVYVYIRSTIGSATQTDYRTVTMRIVNAAPTLSPTVVDTNSVTTRLTGNSSILVALHSTAKVTVNAAAQKYATIKSKKVEHGAVSLTGDGTLSVTNNPIKFTVTDSRGNTTTANATNTIVPYINPTCSISNNTPETDGSFALAATGLFYNGAIGKTTNAIEVQYRYKAAGGSYGNWTTFGTVSKSGNSYTATANLTGLDYQTVYTFQARVIDAIHDAVNVSSVYSAEKAVISEPVFDWSQNDFRFNVPVAMRKNGLGLTAYDALTLTDANEGINNGWYRITEATQNGVGVAAVMRTDAYSSTSLMQTAFSSNYSSKYPLIQQRVCMGGTWGGWEWLNPPMELETTYRTTERYQGKVVYAKLVNFGALPNNTSKSVSYCGSGSTGAVSLTAMLSDGCVIHGGVGRDLNVSSESTVTLDCTKSNVRIRTDADFSHLTACVLVKYTVD